jgi:hypothetical protein
MITPQEGEMGIRSSNNVGIQCRPGRLLLLSAVLTLSAAGAHAATFGPGSQLVATFTAKPNTSDLIFFFDNDSATVTGSPVFTTSIYDGQTLLGTATTGTGTSSTFVAAYSSSTSLFQTNTTIPFGGINAGTIKGRIVTTVTGGSVTNFNPANVILYDAQSKSSNSFVPLTDVTLTGITLNPPTTSSLPHFVYGGGFVTGFYALNANDQPATFTVNFYDDTGKPVALPFTGTGPSTTLTDTLPARGLKYYEAGTYSAALVDGSGSVTATPSVTVQALMRRQGSDGSFYEAAVEPAAGYKEFQIPFDATIFTTTGAQIYTGFAIANLDSTNAAAVSCTARDSNGNIVANAVSVPALNPLGHWANYLFPLLTGLRGTLDCTSTTTIGAIAIRAIGTNAISTLPVIPVH